MSEIFEALQKAQREADERQTAPPGDDAAGTEETQGRPADEAEHSPPATPVRPRRARRRRRKGRWFQWLRGTASQNGHGGESAVLISPDRETTVGEQFRILRTRVEMAGPGTVMITSALDQEGKTLCATNLAVALSMRIGAEVVLVDADLRHPSVGASFGLPSGPGLVDCLLGEARWQDCIVKTEYQRLSILPAGHSSSHAPELLGSERMATVLAELKEHFSTSYVVVDAPPLLLTADPMVIARQVDHILLVVRAGVTPRDAVMKAVHTIGSSRVFGVILNDVTKTMSHYYYYYGRPPYLGHTEKSS
jgi:protein-tyrosine kinase